MCDHTWIEDTTHGGRERHFICCHCKAELTKPYGRAKPFLMFAPDETQVAGTSFKTHLARLEPETPDADKLLKKLGYE